MSRREITFHVLVIVNEPDGDNVATADTIAAALVEKFSESDSVEVELTMFDPDRADGADVEVWHIRDVSVPDGTATEVCV
jgi:hypothetical protein